MLFLQTFVFLNNETYYIYIYITICLLSDIPDVVSIDITDNKIETQTANHLDRKKRDVDGDSDSEDTVTETTETNNDQTSSDDDGNESDDLNIENGKRTVRQLRPLPPIGPWPFADNFDLPNDHRLHSTSRAAHPQPQSGHFPRDTELSSVNYNTFLTPPGGNSRSNDFFKNDGSASSYYHLPSFSKQNEYNPYGNPYGNYKSSGANAVTEFNSPKPYTLHTTFDVGDAQTHFKPSKLVSQQPFYPLVQNNGVPQSAKHVQKPHNSALSSSSSAGDVDSLPENFSYYHMSNGVQIKQELNRHQHTPQHQHQHQQQQIQQQIQKIPHPQPPIYYLDKPQKILSASTPKTHYVHISTVGGFLNNNPTAFASINQKKPKNRPNSEKYNDFTHRPVYREPATVHENNQNNNIYSNSYSVQENTDISPYYNPIVTQRPTIAAPAPAPVVTSPKALFNNELPFSNFDQNKSPKPLYSYEVTTDDVKSSEKNKGFYITQSVKDTSVEKLTRPSIKVQTHESKIPYDAPLLIGGQKNRPAIVGPQVGVNFDFNKFVYDIRESQHQPKPTPKYAIARPIQPETIVIRPNNNKPIPKKIQTTTSSPDDYYYDVDEEEPLTTTAKRPAPAKEHLTTTPKHSTSTLVGFTTKAVKTNLISGFSQPHSVSTPQTYETTYKEKDPKYEEDYYEYDDEDDATEIKMPPQNVSKFMPMSETAAPRPYLTTVKSLTIVTQRPLTTPTTKATTTKKYSTTFERQPYTKSRTETTTSSIPAIIKFPDDVFQGVRSNPNEHTEHPRYLNQSTLRPYTSRTRSKATNLIGPVKPSKAPKMHIKTTSKTTSTTKLQTTHSTETTKTTTPTTSTPKTKTFTIRAKHNYNNVKGQQHSQSQSQSQPQSTNLNRWKQANKSQKAQRTNALKKNLWELDERLPNRYHHFLL